MYERGVGIDKDYSKAFTLFQQAAFSGHSAAQYNLAILYEDGKGVDKDVDQAIYWHEQSAEQGNQYAQNKLAKLI